MEMKYSREALKERCRKCKFLSKKSENSYFCRLERDLFWIKYSGKESFQIPIFCDKEKNLLEEWR